MDYYEIIDIVRSGGEGVYDLNCQYKTKCVYTVREGIQVPAVRAVAAAIGGSRNFVPRVLQRKVKPLH
ncbi:hypothetical protein TNCV_4542661 [Trichonephila clavipes]|nr:hypothetical protein TNCV_4542661 [Trichonephila clavipes]